ncbi:GntR family transcriptional regulator YhfZ [Pseudoleptotrichia goodfellowii]|jgi:DNA-binding protein|uniref:Uncharacterized protein n=1 Tax=Pseudoleptotrichia goodfellowii F0264 TaxID=596323 RepID=D0GNT0_9FUSO|nr:GntR family transcriptional regulator YhfZ [Pseudoleptotrichia goodfellowii]EEY34257.1 hypothetical protein HMPREF0554_2363 [Pseudoleptotrichia goodfellowii F0264]
MNNSEEKRLNKKNRSVLFMARELLFSKVGERIAPVTEYSEKYGISVGLIQRAFVLLQNEGAIKLDKRGVLGSFVKEINNEILLEKSDLGFLVGVMPLPYSKRYEGLATGIKNNFQNYNLNYYFAYMSGSGVRLNLLRNGIYDFAVVSKLAYEIERERNGDIESVFEFGAKSYVSKHVLLKAPGVKKIVKIGVDRNSEDQKFLTKEFLGDSNYEFVEIDYNETLKLLENKIVDGIIWNYDEIEEKSIKMEYDELPENKILKKANEAVLVISRRNDNLRKLSRKIIDVDYIREIQQKVLTNQILPTY